MFAQPTISNIKFSDIESLIKALGGEIREGDGSRVVLEFFGTREYAHRPHPGKEAKKYKEGSPPAKPYSGKLTLRVSPGIHAEIAAAAAHAGKSLNKWVADTLDQVVHSH